MSLGCRVEKRGRAAVSAFITSTPREPLLFLYPSWLRHASTSSAGQAESRPSNGEHTDQHNVPDKTGVVSERFPKERISGSSNYGKISDQEGLVRRRESRWRPREIYHTKNISIPEPTPQQREIRVRRTLSIKSEKAITAEKRHFIREVYYTVKRELKPRNPADWREVLGAISRPQPKNEPWLTRAVEVLVPESSAAMFITGIDDNIWEISRRFECSIYWDKSFVDEKKRLIFYLSGAKTAIHRTASEILRLAPESVLQKAANSFVPPPGANFGETITLSTPNPDAPVPWKGGHDGSVRAVFSPPYTKSHYRQQIIRPEELPVPKAQSCEQFYDYISNLISLGAPGTEQGLLYKKKEHRYEAIIETLKRVFLDPDYKHVLSRSAFNKALLFCVQHNQMAALRVFFARMEAVGVRMSVETFNHMLLGAGKQQDLHNFEFILRMMLKNDIAPNGKTWICFMMTMRSPTIRLHILEAMKERGFLRSVRNMKLLAEQFAADEIEVSLQNGLGQDDFIKHMDKRFGPYWLTTGSGNQVLHGLGSRGLLSRCWDFLFVMASRDVRADNISVSTILDHCKTQRNIHAAVQLLQNLPPAFGRGGYVPDSVAYNHLFEMAWRGRQYNLCKVIWRYACLTGHTSFTMRTRVLESLRNACLSPREGETSREPWYRSAGFFIFGLDHCNEHPAFAYEKSIGGHDEARRLNYNIFDFINTARRNFAATEQLALNKIIKDTSTPDQITTTDSSTSDTSTPDQITTTDTSTPSQNNIRLALHPDPQKPDPFSEPASSFFFQSSKTKQTLRRWHYLAGINLWPKEWWTPENATKYATLQAWAVPLGTMRDCDRRMFEHWAPAKPFAEMLDEAWARDLEWRALEYSEDEEIRRMARTMEWRLENAVTVGVVTTTNGVDGWGYEWK